MNPSHQSELLNTVLQFHDSEVSCVESVKGDVHVSFSAAHVQRSHGTPGRDVSHGYAQAVELCLYQAAWSGILNECVGSLSEGELKVDGCAIKRVPLPFQNTGVVTLQLQFSNGAWLSATGTSVDVFQSGQPQFVENFAC